MERCDIVVLKMVVAVLNSTSVRLPSKVNTTDKWQIEVVHAEVMESFD